MFETIILNYTATGEFNGFYIEEINEEIPTEMILKVDEELWKDLIVGCYKVNLEVLSTIQNKTLTLEDKESVFVKIEPEVIKMPEEVDPVKSLAKQVGLLTLENKKKDVQIESLMKAVKVLTSK